MFLAEWFFGLQLLHELIWFALLLIVVVTVTSTRAAPDPGGLRLRACFLTVVMGASLGTAVLASTFAIRDFAALVQEDDGHDEDGGWYGYPPGMEEAAEGDGEVFVPEDFEEPGREAKRAGALRSGLIAAVAFVVFQNHRRRLHDLLDDEEVRAGAVGTVAEGYRHVASFVGLVALAGGAATALYAAAVLGAPEFFTHDDVETARRAAAQPFFTGAWLAAVGVGVLTLHGDDEVPGDTEEDEDMPAPEPPAEEAPIP